MFAIRNASSRPHNPASSSSEIRRMRPAGTTSVAGRNFWSRPRGIRPLTRIWYVLVSWVHPAVADMRTRLAHGRLAELHPKRVIALAVGEPIRVPYLKLYDDGYYRPRSPTGRGQCHTDSGFGRAVWRCPLTFRPRTAQRVRAAGS